MAAIIAGEPGTNSPTSALPHAKQLFVVIFVLTGPLVLASIASELGRPIGILPVNRARLSKSIWFATAILFPIAAVTIGVPIALFLSKPDDVTVILARGLWVLVSVVGICGWSAVMQSMRKGFMSFIPLIVMSVVVLTARPIGVSLFALDTAQAIWYLLCAVGVVWSYARRTRLVAYPMDAPHYRSRRSAIRKGPWKWGRNRYWGRIRYNPITFQSFFLCAASVIAPLSVPLMRAVDPMENAGLSVILFMSMPLLAFAVLCGNLSVMRPMASMPWGGWQRVRYIVLGFALAHAGWIGSAAWTEAIFADFPFGQAAIVIMYSFGATQVFASIAFLIQRRIARIVFLVITLSIGLFGPFILVVEPSLPLTPALLGGGMIGMLIGPWLLFYAQQRSAASRAQGLEVW